MQRRGGATSQNAAPFSSTTSIFHSNQTTNTNASATTPTNSSSPSKRRPATSAGDPGSATTDTSRQPNVLHKDRERRPSFSIKATFGSPSRGKRRANSSSAPNGPDSDLRIVTDSAIPPALPDRASLAALSRTASRDADVFLQSPRSADSFSKMLGRTAPTPVGGFAPNTQLAGQGVPAAPPPNEAVLAHQHIQEVVNKRISTLDYLRKAHEGRVYWFNTLLFDKPDLARMPYFDSRKLARRATNYLLLGLSLPLVIDLNSSSPIEFLRSLNTLLTEFESFQSLHSENGSSNSLSRARIPHMFRRAAPGSKGRRTSSASAGTVAATNDANGYPLESADTRGGSSDSVLGNGGAGGTTAAAAAGMMNFAATETDLLPGEEYTHLLTPSLPFDPDFFETFATLCDMLIDCYTRLLSLIPTPRECTGSVHELFSKADGRVRKIIVQGVVKEFEDASRAGVRTEAANVGKVVLSGLM
ncbi:hypothetical protein VTK73DRAFT_739 [Phialemonium thermophilum]|uniref:Uncharacterized protein n=1 Tax=Phialemonium thermophilum TaxID=223376 RepID=A0ABR3XDX5_9PEZI